MAAKSLGDAMLLTVRAKVVAWSLTFGNRKKRVGWLGSFFNDEFSVGKGEQGGSVVNDGFHYNVVTP